MSDDSREDAPRPKRSTVIKSPLPKDSGSRADDSRVADRSSLSPAPQETIASTLRVKVKKWDVGDWFAFIGLLVNCALLLLTVMLVLYTNVSLKEARESGREQLGALKLSAKALSDQYQLVHSQYETQLAVQHATPRLLFSVMDLNRRRYADWRAFAGHKPFVLSVDREDLIPVAFLTKNVGDAALINGDVIITSRMPKATLKVTGGCFYLTVYDQIECRESAAENPYSYSNMITEHRVTVSPHGITDFALEISINGQNGSTGRAVTHSEAIAYFHVVSAAMADKRCYWVRKKSRLAAKLHGCGTVRDDILVSTTVLGR